MAKVNCWQFKKCGRQPTGDKADELGVCPAANESLADGINSGIEGGGFAGPWQVPCAAGRFKALLPQNLPTACSANPINWSSRKRGRLLSSRERFWKA